MDPQNMKFTFVVIILIMSVLTTFLTFLLRKRMLQKKESAQAETKQKREPERFVGERVYSLALRGKYKFVLRAMYAVVIVIPVVVMMVLSNVAGHHPQGLAALSGKLWILMVVMAGWSGSTILFLRTMSRRRQGTRIVLSIDGVRYLAPKVGIFPLRDVFIRWDRIESVRSENPQHPSVITVSSPEGSFHFDSLHAREVSPYVVNGEFTPLDNRNDLHRDLVEYSSLQTDPKSSLSPQKPTIIRAL